MRILYIAYLFFFFSNSLFAQVAGKGLPLPDEFIELIDFYVDGQDLVFEINQKKIYDDKEKYKLELYYRVIIQNRFANNRDNLNQYNKVLFTESDTPILNPGKRNFRVDINKYLPELLNSEVTINFKIESTLNEIPIKLDENNIRASKDKISLKGSIENLIGFYRRYDPSIQFSYIIRGNSIKDIYGTLKYVSGKIIIDKIDPKLSTNKEYSFILQANKYGKNSDQQNFKIKRGWIGIGYVPETLIVIAAGAFLKFVILSSGEGKLNPPLSEPPDPNG